MRLTEGRRKLSVGFIAAITVVMAAGVLVFAPAAGAQDQTGASATKDCPPAPVGAPYTIGDTVPCTATFSNDAAFDGTVTSLTETAPFITTGNPDNGVPSDISCTLPDTTVIQAGSALPPGTPCSATFDVTIPNDPALCNTVFRDRVEIALEYTQFDPPLEAGAFATHTIAVVCPPTISVTKTADTLSKVGDPVDYSITVCNTGLITVTKQSVIDSLIGDVTGLFGATLAPGACDTQSVTRTVVAGDPDPLINTVTATYTAGVQSVTESSQATTELFQPGVDVTKSCSPDPVTIGAVETCVIGVSNTSSADSPDLASGTITDTLNGDLLAAGNPAVASSDCTTTLAVGASCTITTTRTVLASDPSPLVNTVTVLYHPVDFPNDITDSATASVTIEAPPPVGACHETVNPAGKPGSNTSNGFPDDPFGGHAVPGGKSTSPGTNGNGPINSDGFYLVSGNLFSDTTPIAFPGGGDVWPENTTVKYTQRPGNPNITITAMAGPNSVITYQIQAPGDLYAGAAKGDPGAVFCGVPPPPF